MLGGGLPFNRIVVTSYQIFLEQAHYASSPINLRLAAVKRLAYEAADSGLLSSCLANWLTAEQGSNFLSIFDRTTFRGKRDYLMVAVLLGCALQRAELAAAQVGDLQQRDD